MQNRGFDIIDVHHHYEAGYGVGEFLAVANGPGQMGRSGAAALELATRLSIMDMDDVGLAIVIAGHTYLRPNGIVDTRAVNDAVADYLSREPTRLIAGVGVVEPLYGEVGLAEIRRCKHELGLAGISFHNRFQGAPIDSPLMTPLIEAMGDVGLIPFIHAYGTPLETLTQVDSLAGRFPELPILVLDVFHDVNQIRALPEVARRRPNLHFDLSLLVNFETLGLPLVRELGAHRFLFGTDQYSWPLMTTPYGCVASGVIASDLSDTDKAMILSGNARRLLGADVYPGSAAP
jgi:predicted TIM-barrel fold metal-dependent hydrolase